VSLSFGRLSGFDADMPAPFRVHLIQIDPVWEDRAPNHAKARQLIADAAPQPGSLIILPEMFATGFSMNVSLTAEPPEEAPTEQFLRETAARHQCAVIGGLVTRSSDGRGLNQALAVAPEGHVLTRYTKNRPFSLGGEDQVHQAGTEVAVFEWQGLKIAPLICYDLRFPELARQAVRAGAEVLVYIAAWPARRFQHWITLLQARAIENQAYAIGVNRCGTDPQFSYSGRSLVADPHGVIIADASEQERVVSTQIDPEVVRGWRAQFPALKDAGLPW
jgi:predicted amidohydrolase